MLVEEGCWTFEFFMGVSLEQYRVCIGCFNISFCMSRVSLISRCVFSKLRNFLLLFLIFCLVLSGDVEVNPGPNKRETTLSLSVTGI